MHIFNKTIVLLSLLPVIALASNKTLSNTKIDNVRVRHHVAYIKFSGCTNYSRLYLNSDYAKAMYSTALTAGAARKSVSVEFNGETCSGTEAELIYLDLRFN